MTNRHVFDAALSLNPPDIRAVFDYSGDQSYESLPRKKIVLTPVAMSEVNDLDYAVLKMARIKKQVTNRTGILYRLP